MWYINRTVLLQSWGPIDGPRIIAECAARRTA